MSDYGIILDLCILWSPRPMVIFDDKTDLQQEPQTALAYFSFCRRLLWKYNFIIWVINILRKECRKDCFLINKRIHFTTHSLTNAPVILAFPDFEKFIAYLSNQVTKCSFVLRIDYSAVDELSLDRNWYCTIKIAMWVQILVSIYFSGSLLFHK